MPEGGEFCQIKDYIVTKMEKTGLEKDKDAETLGARLDRISR